MVIKGDRSNAQPQKKKKDVGCYPVTSPPNHLATILGDPGAVSWVGRKLRTRRKFSSTGERAPGYRLSPNYFEKFKQMPAPDWAQKMLCIIVPNRGTVSPEFFS